MANLSNINGKFVVEQTTGYVGIGTTDPNFLIEAAGTNSEIALNSTSGSIYRVRSTSGDAFIITKNGVGDRLIIDGAGATTFSSSIDAGGRIKVSGGNTDQYYFEGARNGVGVTYRLYDNANNIYHDSWSSQVIRLNQNGGSGGNLIISGGNVGIGTSSPSATLDVLGSSALFMTRTSSGLATYIENDGGYAAQYMYQLGAGARIALHTNGNSYFNGGNVGIGTTLPVEKLSVYDGNISINNSHSFMVGGATGDTIIGRLKNTAGVFNLEANSTRSIRFGSGTNGEVVRIDNVNERVGIGTASPTAKLDIAGDVRYQGDIYSEYTYNGSGNYSSGTIYTIASTGQLTINGMYQLVMYLDDFGAGGSTYFSWFCSVPFYWVTTGTNRIVSQNLPALIGTGHAIGTIPTFTITQEMGTAGGQAKIRFNPQNNWTNINGTSGRKFVVYVKRLGG